MSAKSLWNWITNRSALGTPSGNDLIPYAPQPGVSLVTEAMHATFSAFAGAVGALGPVQVATLQLTDAQIKSLPTDSPVSILAASLVGVNLPIAIFARLTPWFVDYATIDVTASLKIQYPSLTLASSEMVGILSNGQAAAFPVDISGALSFGLLNLSDFENQPIELVCTNGALGNFTGGDARQFLTISVLYMPIFIGI